MNIMLSPVPRQIVRSQPVQKRRPTDSFLQVICSNSAVSLMAKELEQNPLFKALVEEGIVRKVHLRGLISDDRYRDYMLEQAVTLVRHYQLDSKAEWKQALMQPCIKEHLPAWARNWGVPEGELYRILHILRDQHPARSEQTRLRIISGEPLSDVLDGNLATIINTLSVFVSRYRLSQQEVIDWILSGEYSPRQLTMQYGCSLLEAETLMEQVMRIEIANAFNSSSTAAPKPEYSASTDDEMVADVCVRRDGILEIQWLAERINARYIVNEARLGSMRDNGSICEQLVLLMERIRALNQRSSILASIVNEVCMRQQAFILSGELKDLAPLQQSDVARFIGCHRSAVNRLSRGQLVNTPFGCRSLSELMPRRHEVILRIGESHPEWTAGRIARHMLERHNIRISRRAICYHLTRDENTSSLCS